MNQNVKISCYFLFYFGVIFTKKLIVRNVYNFIDKVMLASNQNKLNEAIWN